MADICQRGQKEPLGWPAQHGILSLLSSLLLSIQHSRTLRKLEKVSISAEHENTQTHAIPRVGVDFYTEEEAMLNLRQIKAQPQWLSG